MMSSAGAFLTTTNSLPRFGVFLVTEYIMYSDIFTYTALRMAFWHCFSSRPGVATINCIYILTSRVRASKANLCGFVADYSFYTHIRAVGH